jgi:hypothetical protein
VATQPPTKLVKRIAGMCLYSGCDNHALDGSDFCAPHDAHERGRDANKKKRRRQRRAEAGLCVAGCGRKVGKQRNQDGSLKRRECPACRKDTRERARRARKERQVANVPGDQRAVPGDTGLWRPDPGGDYERIRYRGKGRRGQLTREQQIDEDIRDVGFAQAELDKLTHALEQLKRPEVMDLPRVQREAASRSVMLFIGAASRFLDGLAEKYE